MTLITCLDNQNGLFFHGRRQSQDRLLLDDMLQETAAAHLWMSPYSRKLFPAASHILVAEDFWQQARPGDFCFLEGPYPPALAPSRLLLYRWNRAYPADCFLPFSPREQGFRLLHAAEFPGHSHERITKEIYER